jgi:hypothetical protein
MVSVSHNGGHDDRWNMKIYVIFVLLLKVNRLRYYENIVTSIVYLVYISCLYIVRCMEKVQIKENVLVKMKCEVSCLNLDLNKI